MAERWEWAATSEVEDSQHPLLAGAVLEPDRLSQDDSIKGAYAFTSGCNVKLTVDQTMLNCIDNSGAAIVECAMVVGQKRHASIGT